MLEEEKGHEFSKIRRTWEKLEGGRGWERSYVNSILKYYMEFSKSQF